MTFWKRKQVHVTNLPETGMVGQLIGFNIDASEAGKAQPQVFIDGGSVRCTLTALENHCYHAAFTPQEAKVHTIQMKFNGRNLPKNPYTIAIHEKVTVIGPGLGQVDVNETASFTVYTGRHTRQVLADIMSPSGIYIECYICNKHDGNYLVEFTPTEIGTYSIEVTSDGMKVNGRPFHCKVVSSKVEVSTVSSYLVGKMAEFEIDTSFMGGKENLEVTIMYGSGEVLPSTVTCLQRGLYLVTFVPVTSDVTYAVILYNSVELPQSPVRLGGQDDPNQSAGAATLRPTHNHTIHHVHNYENVETNLQQTTTHPLATSDRVEDVRLHSPGKSPQDVRRHSPEHLPAESKSDSSSYKDEGDEPRDYQNVSRYSFQDPSWQEYVGVPRRHPRLCPALDALRGCLTGGTQQVFIVRQAMVDDVFELYKDETVADKTFCVEFLDERCDDSEGLTHELFASFWRQVREHYFRGEDCFVPDLPLCRLRKEMWKFECLGRILSHTVALTGTIPPIFSISTLARFTPNEEIEDDSLLEDFLLLVTPREKLLLTKTLSDFGGLSTAESDRLQNFFTAHGYNNIPKGSEIKEQILTIAFHNLLEKPRPLISKMCQGIPESHKLAFWNRLSIDDISRIMQAQKPTPERVANVIITDIEDLTDGEDKTLYFLKEFVESLEFDTLTDFLVFVTGSVHQPDKISVSFTKLTGLDRRPISHTCFNQLEVPTTYHSFREFKKEFLSVLASPESFQLSEI